VIIAGVHGDDSFPLSNQETMIGQRGEKKELGFQDWAYFKEPDGVKGVKDVSQSAHSYDASPIRERLGGC
jgi:hypothetical protein